MGATLILTYSYKNRICKSILLQQHNFHVSNHCKVDIQSSSKCSLYKMHFIFSVCLKFFPKVTDVWFPISRLIFFSPTCFFYIYIFFSTFSCFNDVINQLVSCVPKNVRLNPPKLENNLTS